jgi:hypothetical protein
LGFTLALITLAFYFPRPTIRWDVLRAGDVISVETMTRNWFRRMFDVEYEIVISKDNAFETVRTLALVKTQTLFSERPPDKYTIRTTGLDIQDQLVSLDDYTHIRIRRVAAKFIRIYRQFESRF